MLIACITVLLGLFLLGWSAERLVYGSASLAKNIGISPMVIGMTIIAMGSSAPEMMVSATASSMGNSDAAVGNVLGSNITNITMVLGATLLFRALSISSSLLRREIPWLILATVFSGWVLYDAHLSRFEGYLLLVGFGLLIYGLFKVAKTDREQDLLIEEQEAEIPNDVPTGKAVFWTIVGIVMLPTSAYLLVNGATEIAKFFGISDLVIGLTVLAIGTSLPELAASIAAIRKGEDDMVIGNVVGSNIFNILAVLGISGAISSADLDPPAAGRDLYAMLGITALLVLMSYIARKPRTLKPWFGWLLLGCFIGYQVLLYLSETA